MLKVVCLSSKEKIDYKVNDVGTISCLSEGIWG